MKKRFLRIFSIIAVVLLMSGCVKYNINAKITSDKKMVMELIIATSLNGQQGTGEEGEEGEEASEDEEQIAKLKEAGWSVEEYKEDDYKGSKLSKTFNNIDDVTTDSETIFDLNDLMQKGKESTFIFYKEKGTNVYKAKFKASMSTGSEEEKKPEDMTPEEKQQYEQTQELYKQMMKTMDLKMNVEVPKVVSSNATTTDGNKLTWDLTKMKSEDAIEFSFELGSNGGAKSDDSKSSSFPIVPVAIGGGVALVLIIIIVIVATKKKKNVETPAPAPIETLNTEPEPVAPVEVKPEEPPTPKESAPEEPKSEESSKKHKSHHHHHHDKDKKKDGEEGGKEKKKEKKHHHHKDK